MPAASSAHRLAAGTVLGMDLGAIPDVDAGAVFRQLRQDAGLTQVDLGAMTQVRLDRVSLVERDALRSNLADFAPLCHALGITLKFVPNDPESGPEKDIIAPNPALVGRRPVLHPAPPSELAEALDILTAVYHAKKRRPRAVLVFDYAYADAIAELVWGIVPDLDTDWASLPAWHELPVVLASGVKDMATLVRSPHVDRWPSPIAETIVVPAGLPEGGADTYRALRAEGHAQDRAHAIAALVCAR